MNSIIHFFQAGGWVMYPLLILSVTAVAVIIERTLAYRTLANISRGLLDEVSDLCRRGHFDAAQQACEAKPGPVAACLAAVIRHRDDPVEDIERNVQEVGEEYFIKLEKLLPILDTTTTISPLLGLLGTLFGMIATFQAIAASKNQGANDSILSGVGEALYATATGLTIAVVCFAAYNYFAARQRLATSETEQSSTKLINVLRARQLVADEPRQPQAVSA
ncbi:MAG: MotA/TolQ/ExbB proton channel family protein [Fimbriimonadales bacterium]